MNSSLLVNGGTLRLNVNSGAATVLSGVTATVAGSATLELAGSISALSSPIAAADRVNIANWSNAAAGGLYVSGNHQEVGAIDGTGSVVIGAGADLTANHIVQSSLVIGAGGTFTLAPSDTNGSPLDSAAADLGLAQSLSGAVSMIAPNSAPFHDLGELDPASVQSAPLNPLPANSGIHSVPEPESLVVLLGGLGTWLVGRHLRRGAIAGFHCVRRP